MKCEACEGEMDEYKEKTIIYDNIALNRTIKGVICGECDSKYRRGFDSYIAMKIVNNRLKKHGLTLKDVRAETKKENLTYYNKVIFGL